LAGFRDKTSGTARHVESRRALPVAPVDGGFMG
jgi:hypothetical protein